jgi:hypothetical protein
MKKIKKKISNRMQEEGEDKSGEVEKGRKGVDGIVFISDVECDDDLCYPRYARYRFSAFIFLS